MLAAWVCDRVVCGSASNTNSYPACGAQIWLCKQRGAKPRKDRGKKVAFPLLVVVLLGKKITVDINEDMDWREREWQGDQLG